MSKLILPKHQPVHADKLAKSYGICSHANFASTVYGDTQAWFDAFSKIGATYFRSMFAHNLTATQKTLALCRERNVGWVATLTPATWDQPETELMKRLVYIRDHASDVIIAIEGVNEPNESRTSTPPPKDWAERTVKVQKTIYEFVQANMPHIKVIGPSLHALVSTAVSDHYKLGALGIGKYMDYGGLHRYFGGRYPDYLVDERVQVIRDAFKQPDMPVWVTETGYTNSVANLTQHKPVPEEVSAAYGPITLMEFFSRNCKMIRYELLDDPDPGPKDVVESNFGLVRTPLAASTSWQEKLEASVMRDLLNDLSDPGDAFTPRPVRFEVHAPDQVRWLLVGFRSGEQRLLLWQRAQIFDPYTQRYTPQPRVTVEVQRRFRKLTTEVPAGKVVNLRLNK